MKPSGPCYSHYTLDLHVLYIRSMWCRKCNDNYQKLDLCGAPACTEQFRFSCCFTGKNRNIKLRCVKSIRAESIRDKSSKKRNWGNSSPLAISP